jgi:hypothetical protein
VVVDFQQGWSQTRAEMEVRLTDQTTLQSGHDAGIPAADIVAQGRRLADKFHGLAAPVLGEARAQALQAALAGLDDSRPMAPMAALWGDRAAA